MHIQSLNHIYIYKVETQEKYILITSANIYIYIYKSNTYPTQLEGIPPFLHDHINSPLWEFIDAWSGKRRQPNDSSGIRVIASITECTWYAHEHSKGHKIRLENTSKGITSKSWLQKKSLNKAPFQVTSVEVAINCLDGSRVFQNAKVSSPSARGDDHLQQCNRISPRLHITLGWCEFLEVLLFRVLLAPQKIMEMLLQILLVVCKHKCTDMYCHNKV